MEHSTKDLTSTNTIYLVRHGENPANINKEFSCRYVDYPLTEKGVMQAQQTAAYFTDKNIHQIYASPLKRARETAEIIAAPLGLTVGIIENFREINVGELEMQPPTAENWDFHNQTLITWITDNPDIRFPGGENYHILWERMRSGVVEVVSKKSQKNIIIVGHGGIFTMTIKKLCSNVDWQMLRTTPNHNCSISRLKVETQNGNIEGELHSWAAHHHLHGKAAQFVSGVP